MTGTKKKVLHHTQLLTMSKHKQKVWLTNLLNSSMGFVVKNVNSFVLVI